MKGGYKIGSQQAVRIASSQDVTKCVHCRQTFSSVVLPSFEHLVPASQGGTVNDIAIACTKCNCERGDISLEQFYSGFVRRGPRVVKIRGPRRWYHGDLIKWYP